jgi:hypothetical protein
VPLERIVLNLVSNAVRCTAAGCIVVGCVDRLRALLDHPIELISAVGKGSRFGVTVPTAAARAPARPKIEPPTQDAIDAARGKLVVVIDNDVRVLEVVGLWILIHALRSSRRRRPNCERSYKARGEEPWGW